MAGFKKVVTAESVRKEFDGLLEKIIERIKSQFANPLVIEFYEPSIDDWSPSMPFLYIAEVSTKYWLWIVPRKKKRKLFAISPSFHPVSSGGNAIRCNVHDASVFDIIKEELNAFADSHRVTEIQLSQEN